jgi:hypothetical protein
MLSFQLRENIGLALSAYEDAVELRNAIAIIQNSLEGIGKYFGVVGDPNHSGQNAGAEIRNILNGLRRATRDIKPRKLFSSIEEFKEQMFELSEGEAENIILIEQMLKKIDSFAEAYEAYIQSYSTQDAGSLILEANNLAELMKGVHLALQLVYLELEDNSSEPEVSNEFSIYLAESMALNEFAKRLMAIHNLYETIANLLLVDLSNAPLTLKKIESGSLWSKVIGDSRVIGLMIHFIRSSASFLYRNYTKEGRIGSIPQKLDSLNAIMDFTERLKGEGVDVTGINEEMRKAAFSIAKDINTLIEDQSEITVNGETQSLLKEGRKGLMFSEKKLGVKHTEENLKLPQLPDSASDASE